MMDYPIVIVELSAEDGGGYMGFAPDLAGCMSDGETRQQALENTIVALHDWLEECARLGREAPEPGSAATRAREERDKLIEIIHTLSSINESFDVRLANLAEELSDLRSWMSANTGWTDLSRVSSVEFTRGTKKLPFHA